MLGIEIEKGQRRRGEKEKKCRKLTEKAKPLICYVTNIKFNLLKLLPLYYALSKQCARRKKTITPLLPTPPSPTTIIKISEKSQH